MALLRPTRSLTNLPVQATPFIGREQEVSAACHELLRPEVRLLTLTGPGGVGKTRLALATAARVQAEFPDGVVFLPLAPVTDPNRVVPAIAAVLGVRETGERSLMDSLTALLGTKRCLLVLDNFEQVVEAAGAISQLLGECANLKILVTSRSALRVYGEQIWSVEPLSLPASGQRLPLVELAQYDAVRLFAARARAVRPDFALSAENAETVIEVCRRLDGLPLAIELAAARVRLFSLAALLARLDRRLKLLTGGARDLPARQQTLRATMSWSYDLLSDEEKKLFRRLAVFVGGWTLEAAAAVSGGGGPLDLDILDGLQSLLEKSLLRSDEVNGEPRFGMLETMREFALERLTESGEQDEAEQQHAAYFIELMKAAEPFLISVQRRSWLVRLVPEQDNLRAIFARSAESTDPTVRAAGIRIAYAFASLCSFHGNVSEGRTSIQTALKSRADALPADQGRALYGAGILAWRLGDSVAALEYVDEAMPYLRLSGYKDGYASASGMRCLLLASVKGAKAALAYRPEAEALMRGADSPWIRALCGQLMGSLSLHHGDYAEAEIALQESLALFRDLKDAWSVAEVVTNLGDLARRRGDDTTAAAYYTEGLEIDPSVRNPISVPPLLHNLGHLALRGQDVVRARHLFVEALTSFRDRGDTRGVIECLAGLAGVLAAEGHPERASTLFGAVEAQFAVAKASLHPSNQADYDHNLALTRSLLEPSAFTTRRDEGKQMTFDQAVACALVDQP